MEGLYMISMEKILGLKPLGGMSRDAVFANRLASEFSDLGIELILKYWKELVISITNVLYFKRRGDKKWIWSLTYLTMISESPKN